MKKQKLFSGENTDLHSIQLASLGSAAADDVITSDAQARVPVHPGPPNPGNHEGETEPSPSFVFKTPVLRIPPLKIILEKICMDFQNKIFSRFTPPVYGVI